MVNEIGYFGRVSDTLGSWLATGYARARQFATEKWTSDMKRIISYALPVVVVLALLWGYSKRTESETTTHTSPSKTFAAEKSDAKRGGADDPVLIRINDDTITKSEFEQAFDSIPENVRPSMDNPEGRRSVAQELVRMRLLVAEARKRGLDKDPEVENAIKMNTSNILASAALRAMVDEQKDTDLRKIYERNKDQFAIVGASQIVVAYDGGRIKPRSGDPLSKDAAMKKAEGIVRQLRAGADFAKMAEEVSDDASASQGGKIGKFTRDNLPDEISGPLFRLKVGEVGDPVVSPLGIHIFKVTEHTVRPYEQVEASLKRPGSPLRARGIMDELKSKAKVELDPTYFGKSDDGE